MTIWNRRKYDVGLIASIYKECPQLNNNITNPFPKGGKHRCRYFSKEDFSPGLHEILSKTPSTQHKDAEPQENATASHHRIPLIPATMVLLTKQAESEH